MRKGFLVGLFMLLLGLGVMGCSSTASSSIPIGGTDGGVSTGGNRGTGGTTGAGGTTSAGGMATGGAATGGTSTGKYDAGGSDSAASQGKDASFPPDATSRQADASSLGYTDGGCLSYAGASQLCGDGSPGTICAFSAQCGSSTNAGQCMINCSMGAGYSKCWLLAAANGFHWGWQREV